jgi:hypothetical protein
MRVFLLVAVLNGLVPSLREGIDAASESLRAVLADKGNTSPVSTGETPQRERDCGVLLHVCGCCTAQAARLPAVIAKVAGGANKSAPPVHHEMTPPQVVLDPPLRPPIA